MKSTIKEIEERFDKDVERFSDLNTGQQTTLDAAFNMELITESISRCYPNLKSILDIGCGAGNYSVKLAQKRSDIDFTLVDLSKPMVSRAAERVGFKKTEVSHKNLCFASFVGFKQEM